ncbi:d30e9f3d-078b-4005-9029-f380fe65a38f [Sclerotinia trifoliorum]|uniref:D30e9f3d-078b-4005-9029-f380fe65a38f n=1 Tax=Sclerotinia trifoliorum TaxID=28548 RepID=A0A8H2ZPB5_9HELO|nr:d30e9f3d-078b-4005-9029-f380fe65a38f [Sclerotinia trifoliorum]
MGKNSELNGYETGKEKLTEDLSQLLDDLDRDVKIQIFGSCSIACEAMYKETLRRGLESLIGTIFTGDSKTWDDAMEYGRQVILAPQDTQRRASSPWIRSCSELHSELIKLFGPQIINAARLGTASIIANHYNGDREAISHVNKKESYMRHRHEAKLGAAFYPRSSPLVTGCYLSGTLPCSLALSSFLPVDKAVQAAQLSHLSLCDDYGSFTHADYDVRLRMIALSAGVAYQYGGRVINIFVDGTALQALGIGIETPLSVEAAMAWRAVSGCTTVYSKYNFEGCDLQDGLIGPISMMAAHDLLDWRSDTAAGNHENGVSAVYGLGNEAAFHTYLEALLKMILRGPRFGMYGIGSMIYMHYTVARYASWEYHGKHGAACNECVDLLRSATEGAGLKWAPKPPPSNYEDGEEVREWGRLWTDQFIDRGLMQEAVSWFQYLISSGKIWLFDVLADAVNPVDDGTDWV